MERLARLLCMSCAMLVPMGCVSSSGTWFDGFYRGGWDLRQVTSSWKSGPEFRKSASGDHSVRWSVETGLKARFENGHGMGVSYRNRFVDDGGGGNDNGVWLEYSFPIWTALPKEKKQN